MGVHVDKAAGGARCVAREALHNRTVSHIAAMNQVFTHGAMSSTVSASFLFLQHDEKWKKEKPYHVLFDPPPGLEKSNLNLKQVHVQVKDIRELDARPTIEKSGFQLIEIEPGNLSSAEFDDDEKVASVFLPRAAEAVKDILGAQRIQFFDTTVCSHPRYSDPLADGE
jgi:hypothetical protein